jgi:hypothetical protein
VHGEKKCKREGDRARRERARECQSKRESEGVRERERERESARARERECVRRPPPHPPLSLSLSLAFLPYVLPSFPPSLPHLYTEVRGLRTHPTTHAARRGGVDALGICVHGWRIKNAVFPRPGAPRGILRPIFASVAIAISISWHINACAVRIGVVRAHIIVLRGDRGDVCVCAGAAYEDGARGPQPAWDFVRASLPEALQRGGWRGRVVYINVHIVHIVLHSRGVREVSSGVVCSPARFCQSLRAAQTCVAPVDPRHANNS